MRGVTYLRLLNVICDCAPASNDEGIDIVLRKDSDIVAAQCKALKKKVGVAVGRELAAAAKDFGANQRQTPTHRRAASRSVRHTKRAGGSARFAVSLTRS